MNSIMMTLKAILDLKGLIIGDEVLKHLDCEYSEVLQRNYNRGKEFTAGLINTSIVHGIIGGNIVLYTLLNGTILVLDGRSRLMGFRKAIYGEEIIDLTSLQYGIRRWTVVKGVNILGEKAYFGEYPAHIKETVLNTQFQVYMLYERTTSKDEARELFVCLNHGIQKMNKDQMNKNVFFGEMTKLIYKLTQQAPLNHFISHSDEVSDASTGFVGYLANQTLTGTLCSERALKNMLASYRVMLPTQVKALEADIVSLGNQMVNIIGDNKTFRNPANACIVGYVLHQFQSFGIDIEKNANKIKKGLANITSVIVEYEGTAIGQHELSKKQLQDMNRWHINGSALRSATVKKERVEILANYISPELSATDREKLPRVIAK